VLDFGIAKLARDVHVSRVKTSAGMLMGTPTYMSPEQCRGADGVDVRSDIYSLGCILFKISCGRPPFVSEVIGQILDAHEHLEPPPPRSLAPDMPLGLAALIAKMLAKDPNARPQTMDAVRESLDEILRALDSGSTRAPTPPPTPSPEVPPTLPMPQLARTPAPPDERPPEPPPAPKVEHSPSPPPARMPTTPTPVRKPPVPRRSRGVLLAAGAVVIVSMIGATLGVVLSRSPSRTSTRSDAGAPLLAALDAAAPIADAAATQPADANVRAVSPNPKDLLECLRAAEDALREGKQLMYLYWSQSAYEVNPRDVRAGMIYADALFRTGSLDRSCELLRSLKRVPEAQVKARNQGCPTN
jgi:serine/threonine-protein kinase